MADLQIKGAEKFGEVAKALKQAGDKELRKELYSSINRAAKPMTKAVKESMPAYLPRGYALELSKTVKISVRRRASGKNPAVYLVAKAKTPGGKDRDLASLNRGRLRHPLFGNRRHWFDQKVRPDWWTDPLLQSAPQARKEIVKAIDDVAAKLAKKR
jgi:hypothetical protein